MAVNLVDQKNGTFKDKATGKIYKGANIKDAQRAYNAEKIAARTPQASTPAQTATNQLANDIKAQPVDTVAGQVAANKVAADQAAIEAQKLANAGTQINPYGSQTITRDEQGNTVVKQQLDAAQQKILDADTSITQSGRNTAQELQNKYNFQEGFNPELAARTTGDDLKANRQRIEDALYSKLTKDVDTQQQQDRQQAEQTLRNRGIPLGSDLYDREMKKLNDQYQGYRESARQQAIASGGEEYSRDFGINEQLRANQLSEQQGIRNQQIGEVSQFANTGTGLQQPQFQGYQGVGYQTPSATDVYGTVTNAQQNQQQIDIAKRQADAAIAKLNRGSGGGSSSSSTTKSPFNNTTIPGV